MGYEKPNLSSVQLSSCQSTDFFTDGLYTPHIRLIFMLQLEGEYSMSIAEQSQHKQALLALAEVLHTSRQDHLAGLQGLTMKLYHPKAERLFGLKTLNPELYAQLAKPEKVSLAAQYSRPKH